MSTSRQIEAQAADWLARRDALGWLPADEAALNAWLSRSTAHNVAFIRLEAAWNASQKLKALGAGVPKGVIPDSGVWRRSRFLRSRGGSAVESARAGTGPRTGSRRRRGRLALYGLAASLLVAAAVGGVWFLWPEGSVYRTAVGGLEAVPLTDGSKVTLNTDTDVRIELSPSERRVDLQHGEAFFEVAHDATRPFVVRAGDKRVVAVGTKFSVRRDGDEVWVVVTEGKVRLEDHRARSASAPAQPQPLSSSSSGPQLSSSATVLDASSAGSADVVLLPAGSVAHAADAGVLVKEETAAEAEAALSWRQGYVVLQDTPIAEAAAEFNRYNTRKIVIADPDVGEIRIGGNFRSTSTDAFVRLLADGFPIRVDEREEEIVLTKK
jgi:transmembrane sensor